MSRILRSTALSAFVSAALVAGCTSAPPTTESSPTTPAPVESASPEASGEVAASQVNAADVQGWAAGPVPGGDGTGPTYPTTWPASRLVGSGQTTSLTPDLVVPAGAELSGDVDVQVVDLSAGGGFGADGRGEATALAFEGTGAAKGFTVPDGSLADGSTYAWRARKGDGQWAGPWSFAVDTVRSSNAPIDTVDNVEVNLLSGVPAARWLSPTVAGVTGPVGIGLAYRPGQAQVPGLPAGWQWDLPGTGLIAITESETKVGETPTAGDVFGGETGPSSVTLRSIRGGGTTFVRTESGAYVPGLADGTATSYSRGGVLTRTGPQTWQFSTSSGTLTRFEGGRVVGEWSRGNPVGVYTWDESGRLATLSDGISRTLSLAYAGAGTCPASGWGNGFDVPDGLWCAATYADGTQTAVGYSGGQIGLIADPGGVALGFGWDAAGRLAAVRQPTATAAAATQGGQWAGPALTTQLAYDADGRVASLTTAAAAPDGPRLTRRYAYPVGAAEDGKLSAEVTQEGGPTQGAVLSITATSDEWQVLRRVTTGGLVTTNAYDESTGVATKGTDPQGRTTTTKLDDESLVRSSIGPFTGDPGGALRTDRTLDATPIDPEAGAQSRTEPWVGLSAMLWAGDEGTAQWWNEDFFGERGIGGTVGAEGPWEAQASALWQVAESGEWRIEPIAGDGVDVEVIVDGVRCPRDKGCLTRLSKGEHALAIALRGDGPGDFRVTAGRRGEEPRPIPLEDVRPNYNAVTLVTNNDVVSGSSVATKVYDVDRPWMTAPRSVTASGGLVTAFAYEADAPAKEQWGRQTEMTTPGGARMTQAYYATDEQATSPCNDSAAPQAGLTREVVRYDGVRITTVYDAAGRPVAVTTAGDGAAETRCTTYDAAGRTTATTVQDQGGSTLQSATTSYVWANGLLTSTTQYAQAGADNYANATTTNALGQVVTFVDAWGATTTFTYDAEGRLTSRSTSVAGSAAPTLTVDLAYQEGTGQVTSVDANGTRLATVEYSDAGVPLSIEYAGGATQSYSYDTAGVADVTELSDGDLTIVQRRNRNAAGRTLSSSLVVKQGGKATTDATWDYAFDDAGRLVAATLATTGDAEAMGGKKRTFGYDYGARKECPESKAGADFNRTGGSRDGVDFTTCYDALGRLAWTTDPQLAPEGERATASYDGLGRMTRLDARVPLELAWSAGTQVTAITQGDATAELLSVGGQPIRTATPEGVQRLSYPSPTSPMPAIVADDAGTVIALTVNLPGGGIASLDPATAKPTAIDYPDLFLATLATSAGGSTALAAQFGPYGEPLVPTEAVATAYAWQAKPRNGTVTGSHDLTVSARPYHPWLGAFLAFDPDTGASPTGYGYGDGNPLDQPDTTGLSSFWDITAVVLGGVAALMGLASGKVARSLPFESSSLARGAGVAYRVTTVLAGLAGAGIAGARYFGVLGTNDKDELSSVSTWVAAAGLILAGIGTYRYKDQALVGLQRRAPISPRYSEEIIVGQQNFDENFFTENQNYD